MSIPKGIIWQDLRAHALATIPPGTKVSYSAPGTLSRWQQKGYYTVYSSGPKEYRIVTAGVDFGSALLGDTEFFLDHAAEHQVSTWNSIRGTDWFSPAWLIVTFYYWAFFLTLALARMTGYSPWYLDHDANQRLAKLAPIGSRHPGAGSFRLTCGAFLSANDREITLRKSSSRIHDELWQIWFDLCNTFLKKYSSSLGSQLEQRLYAAMDLSARKLGRDWPSALRNAVNYRPGLAYGAVRHSQALGGFSYLRSFNPEDFESLIDRFETSVVGAGNSANDPTRLKPLSELLVDFTFLIREIVISLHEELIDRNGLDHRWNHNRRLFLKRMGQ